MKIESSQILMQMEHQAEQQSSAISLVLPNGPGNSFAELFAYLRTRSGSGSPADQPQDTESPGDAPGLLMANIAGARQLQVNDTPQQSRLLRLVEELLAALEALLLQVGRHQSTGEEPLAEQLGAASAEAAGTTGENQGGQPAWTRITLSQQQESESLCFASQGCVRTADGREVSFQVNFSMARETRSTTLEWESGGLSRLVDPLVLNFPGLAAELSGQRIAFDLSGAGLQESLPLLTGASGYVAFDRNGDGRINDGRELFGAQSGDGFADLATLDTDGNGWLDEGDDSFGQLLLWRPDPEGKGELLQLAELGIGALALQSIATPFCFKEEQGGTQAVLRRSGVWLGENGGAGSLQHLDVAV